MPTRAIPTIRLGWSSGNAAKPESRLDTRDGWAVGVGDEGVDGGGSGDRLDRLRFLLQGVSLEDFEVAVIVVTFGLAARATGSAAIRTAGAVAMPYAPARLCRDSSRGRSIRSRYRK
jgi:hypothetical protein